MLFGTSFQSLNAFTTDFPFLFLQSCLLKVEILHYALAYVITHIKILLLPDLDCKKTRKYQFLLMLLIVQPKSTQQIVISFCAQIASEGLQPKRRLD